MGLDSVVNENSPSGDKSSSTNSGSSRSSGSTSSSESLPEVSFIRDTETGELEVRRYPDSIWSDQTFLNEKAELIIKGKSEFRLLKDRISKQAKEDLSELLRDDPERALKLCKMVKGSGTDERSTPQQTCPVCKQKVNLFKEKYERIGEKVVHRKHTIGDLADAGLLGDIEREWDFVES